MTTNPTIRRAADEPPTIRRAASSDTSELAELAGELGYPTTSGELARRLANLPPGDDVWVAELDGRVAGWVHAALRLSLVAEPHVEVLGLVVRAGCRGSGVGRLLMAAAEDSARAHGVALVRLRSGSHRDGAHAFYRALGYQEAKRQLVFVREVDSDVDPGVPAPAPAGPRR